MNTAKDKKYGRKVKGIRRLMDISQEQLAEKLGYSQSQYSRMEVNDEIDETLLGQIATLLKVPVELIKNFDADSLTRYFINHGDNGNKESEGLVNSGIVEDNNITINNPEDFTKVYKDLLTEKDKIISQQGKLIEDLQKQIESLKK